MTEQALQNLSALPKGWIWTRIDEICLDLLGGGTPSREHPEYFNGDIVWLTPSETPRYRVVTISDSKEKITERGLKKSSARIIPKGSVLLTSRATIGNVAIAGCDVTTNQGFAAFICSTGIYNFYLAYWLLAHRDMLNHEAAGTTFKEISKSRLREFALPLPPLPEQKRILTKIEELFSRLDAGVEALKKAGEQLKRYRQSVLKSAFDGRLTEQWRKENRDKIESASVLLERIKEERRKSGKKFDELPAVVTSELQQLPEGWVWTRLSEIAEINPSLPHNELSDDLEVSFLPMKAVEEETGKYDLSLSKKYSEVKKGYTPFMNGDVIFAKITPCMENGKIAVLDNLKHGIGFGSTEFHVIRCLKNCISNRFIFFYLLQEVVRNDAERKMKGTAGQLRVPSSYIQSLALPLPSLQEQKKIAEEIERLFSIADHTQKSIEQDLAQAERMRQSILQQAFEGKLVPQDPTDEPASVLLERIKAEKAEHEGKNKDKHKDKARIQKRRNKQYRMDSRQRRLV